VVGRVNFASGLKVTPPSHKRGVPLPIERLDGPPTLSVGGWTPLMEDGEANSPIYRRICVGSFHEPTEGRVSECVILP
jgi:hypothetical protein